MSRGLRFWHRIFISAVFSLGVLFGAIGAEASPVKHILFLHAQTEEFPAHKLFENGFKKQFQIIGGTNFEFSYNYLELTKFSSNSRYQEQLAAFLKQKYETKQPDLVVTHLGPAADFALKYGRDIFPGAQFMLAADEVEGVSGQPLPPGFGGVTGIFDVKHTLKLILQLQPEVEKIYVVIGDSERERRTMVAFKKDVETLSKKVEFAYLNTMPLSQMVETVRNIREKAAVLYVHVFKDAAGNVFVPASEVKTFSEAATVPLYIPYAVFMGRGAVGGYLMSTEILGMKAAELGLARLQSNGGPSTTVQVENAEYQFDWRALKRWGIHDSKLPPDSKVLFKQLTMWEIYQREILGGVVLIVFLSFLVAALLINRMRRRRAEELLIQLNADLEQKVAERTRALSAGNEVLEQEVANRRRAEAALREVNESLERMVEERTQEVLAANEELTAQNEIITGMNAILEQRIDERTSDLTAANQELTAQYEELREAQAVQQRTALIQTVLKEIAETAVVDSSTDELYASVHRLIESILPARHFRINLVDEALGEITVPFDSEEYRVVPKRRPIGKGLTEYIMRLGQAVYITPTEIRRLIDSGEYSLSAAQNVEMRHFLGAPLIDSKGKPFGVMSLLKFGETQAFQPQDVEFFSIIAAQVSLAIERKRTEEMLAAERKLLLTVIDTIPDRFFVKDRQNRFILNNLAHIHALGAQSQSEVIGKTDYDFRPAAFADIYLADDEKVMENDEPSYNFEEPLLLPSGEIGTMLISTAPLHNSAGEVIGLVGISRDITERKREEEELRSTSEHLSKLIQYASAPIVVWNPEFIITRFNKAFERLSGYTWKEVVGRHLSVLFPSENLQETNELVEQSRNELHWESVEIPIRCKNGELRITLWNAANVYAADAKTLTAVIAQGHDITGRVRQEQETRLNEQAAKRVQEALLPVLGPSEFLNIATIFEPLGFVGGDLYFLSWRYGGSLLRGFMVDATGHGLATALHTSSLHTLLREVNERDLPISDSMNWLNRRVGEYFSEGIFAGALGFEIDLEIRQLRWVCAGIPHVWMATKTMNGNVKCPGMCLGISEKELFDAHEISIDVGDSFYFMTDGLTDLMEGKEEFPLSQYPEMVAILRNLSKTELRRDDATALCVHVKALPQPLIRQDGWPRIIHFNSFGDYQRLKGEIAKILTEVTGKAHSRQEVAVHEALANALECRDGVPRQHKARLRFNKVGNRLIVRVKTSRMGFAGNAVLQRLRSHPEDMFSFGEDAPMGRGMMIMLTMSHKMAYNSDGTEVLLAWKL